jgi:hypothetical protein
MVEKEKIETRTFKDAQKKPKREDATVTADFKPYWQYTRTFAEKRAAGIPEDQCYTISQGLAIALGIVPC